ncbi:MAG: YbaK/EbsC family protein [Anaerolineales bacterium]
MTIPPVSRYLAEQGVPHTVFRHAGPVTSLEQAAAERGQQPGQVVRSIVFRLGEGNFVMVLAAGPGQVSWPALRAYLGQSRLTMASAEEVLAVTGYAIGTVSPLGVATPLRLLVDEGVWAHDEISLGSGMRDVGIIMKSADLRRLLPHAETGAFLVRE